MELDSRQTVVLRIGALIVGCTLLLTASFVGVIATVQGTVAGFENRIPWYLVAAAGVFVATIVLLEFNNARGKTIIASGVFTGVVSFVLLFFAVEGVLYAIRYPEAIFVSQLVMYFLAAALVATGLGYWGLRHWREFTADRRSI